MMIIIFWEMIIIMEVFCSPGSYLVGNFASFFRRHCGRSARLIIPLYIALKSGMFGAPSILHVLPLCGDDTLRFLLN
jgi:hypothetical protein